MSARSKKSVSVAPGMRHVTVTPVPFSSAREANENESTKAFVAFFAVSEDRDDSP
jgi:hypothetical protein